MTKPTESIPPTYTRRELIRALTGCLAGSASVGALVLLAIMGNYQAHMEPGVFNDTLFSAPIWPLFLPGLLATAVVVATVIDIWRFRENTAERIVLTIAIFMFHVVAATMYWSWVLWNLLGCRR
jgi:hypothetical protein